MEVRAVNEKTQETKTIVTLNEIPAVELSSDEPNLLTIKLPNLVDLSNAATQLGGVRIAYKFTPTDDPETRTNFQKWKRSPDDPQARDWYCRSVIAKVDPDNRARWDAILGQTYAVVGSTKQRYCPG